MWWRTHLKLPWKRSTYVWVWHHHCRVVWSQLKSIILAINTFQFCVHIDQEKIALYSIIFQHIITTKIRLLNTPYLYIFTLLSKQNVLVNENFVHLLEVTCQEHPSLDVQYGGVGGFIAKKPPKRIDPMKVIQVCLVIWWNYIYYSHLNEMTLYLTFIVRLYVFHYC